MVTETFSGFEILLQENGKYVGTDGDEVITDELDSIDEVAYVIDNYYYNMYNNSGYTTTYKVKKKKNQPKTEGLCATMSVTLLEL